MSSVLSLLAYGVSMPARLRGAKIGKGSMIGPGYDWLRTSWKGVTLGSQVLIGRRSWIQTVQSGARIIIGDRTHIGRDAVISSAGSIVIGEDCLFSYRVSLLDHEHEFVEGIPPTGIDLGEIGEISIGSRCFVGCNVTILKNVKIGDDCVIGSGSVVTRSFASNSIIAGVPARAVS